MKKLLLLIVHLCFAAFKVSAQENDYDRSVRTYHQNKTDSSRYAIERAIRGYRSQHKIDSLVLAYTQKALVAWEVNGVENGIKVIDTAISLTARLAPKSVARVAAYSRLGQLYVQQMEFKKAAAQFAIAEKEVDNGQLPNKHYVMLFNQTAIMHLQMEHYTLAQKYAQQAYALNLRVEGKDGRSMTAIVQSLFFISNYSDHLSEALKHGAEFERLVKLHYPAGHPIFGVLHNSLAIIYETLLRYDEALYHRQLAVDVQYKNFISSKNRFSLGAAYQNLGVLYGYLHEGYLSAEYLEKGSKLLAETYREDGAGMVNILVDLAVSKQQAGDSVQAEQLFNRAYALQKKHDPSNWANMAYVESFFGDLYLSQHRYKRAAELFYASLINYKKAGTEYNKTALLTKEALAKTFSRTGQLAKAIVLHREVLDKFKEIYPPGNDAIAGILQGISESYLAAGQLKQSLAYSNLVFTGLLKTKNANVPQKIRFANLPFSYNTSLYVKHRADLLQALYHKTANPRYLKEVLTLTDQYSGFISGNLHLFRTQATLVELAEVNKGIYSVAIEACWNLSDAGKDKQIMGRAFDYSERGKALLLTLAANNILVDAQQGNKSPVGQRDKSFRGQLSSLNMQYIRANHNDSLLTLLSTKMEQYRIFQDSLKRAGNELISSKQRLTPFNLAQIREKLLQQKQTLIEYAVTDKALFTFVLNAQIFEVKRISKKTLTDIGKIKNLHGLTAAQFSGPAHRLYQSLIKQVEPNFSSKRLLIVPDGDLYYINFESLISRPGERNFSRMPYLIREYNISYLLSAASAIQFKNAQHAAKLDKALLFAPVFTDEMKAQYAKKAAGYVEDGSIYQYLYRQPFALKAALQIGRYISGDIFVKQKAGEQAFKKAAPNYRILHLGTHAQVNNQSPLQSRLFFARALPADTLNTDDSYLHAYEIYAMHLKAELAVLTACETGSGVYHQGEGVISLAHSFMYAGCSSVIMSLWKIDDKTSASIITDFYKLLSQGRSKSDALRLAKLQYMDNAPANMSHPYFWAGLALIGDDAPAYPASYYWLWFVLGGILLAGLCYGGYRLIYFRGK